jgi:hypothetical protein
MEDFNKAILKGSLKAINNINFSREDEIIKQSLDEIRKLSRNVADLNDNEKERIHNSTNGNIY